jgi:AcrR family transcriptional regulator
LKEISLRAEITAATLYYHFSSRENLIVETLESLLLPLIQRVWSTAKEIEDPVEMLLTMSSRLLNATKSTPWYLSLWSRELANEGGTLREFLGSRINQTHLQLFLAKIRRGQAEGSLNPQLIPELLFMSLVGLIYTTFLGQDDWAKICATQISDHQVRQHILALLTDGLIKREESRHE